MEDIEKSLIHESKKVESPEYRFTVVYNGMKSCYKECSFYSFLSHVPFIFINSCNIKIKLITMKYEIKLLKNKDGRPLHHAATHYINRNVDCYQLKIVE